MAIATVLAVALLPAPTLAARDGGLGVVSAGSLTITASIDPAVRVAGMAGGVAFDADRQALRTGCVAANTRTRAYALSATQRSGRLKISWSDGESRFAELAEGATATGYVEATPEGKCAARLRIERAGDGPNEPLADVVTILIAPL